MILIAACFDACDGAVARACRGSSQFGFEFDSLADIVSFGVAPSMLIYSSVFHQYELPGLILSSFPLMFAGLRLARFNTKKSNGGKSFFIGLPSPAAACLIVVSFLISYFYNSGFVSARLMLVMTNAVSVLMVSQLKFQRVPFRAIRRASRRA